MHTLIDFQQFLLEHDSPENLIVHPEDFLWLLMRLGVATYPRDQYSPYVEIGATKVRTASPAHDLAGKFHVQGLKYFNVSERPRFADNCERQENQEEKGAMPPHCPTCFSPTERVVVEERTPFPFPPFFSSRLAQVDLCARDRTHSRTEEWLRAAGIAVNKEKENRA